MRAQNTHFVDPSSGRLYIRQEYKDLPKFQNLPKELGVEYFDSTGGGKSPSKLRQKIDQIHRREIDLRLKARQEDLLCNQHFLFRGLVNLSDWFTGTLSVDEQLLRSNNDICDSLDRETKEKMRSDQCYFDSVPPKCSSKNLRVRVCEPHVREEYVDVNNLFAILGVLEIKPEMPLEISLDSNAIQDPQRTDQRRNRITRKFSKLKLDEQDQNRNALLKHNQSLESDRQIVRRDDEIVQELARELAPTQLKVKAFQGLLLTAGITSAVAAGITSAVAAVVMRYRSK